MTIILAWPAVTITLTGTQVVVAAIQALGFTLTTISIVWSLARRFGHQEMANKLVVDTKAALTQSDTPQEG